MMLATLIQQLQEAKAKNLILGASVSTLCLPVIVVIQLPHTTALGTLTDLKQHIKDEFPYTTLAIWNIEYTVYISFTIDNPHVLGCEQYMNTPTLTI
jgi:hypothetical protein